MRCLECKSSPRSSWGVFIDGSPHDERGQGGRKHRQDSALIQPEHCVCMMPRQKTEAKGWNLEEWNKHCLVSLPRGVEFRLNGPIPELYRVKRPHSKTSRISMHSSFEYEVTIT